MKILWFALAIIGSALAADSTAKQKPHVVVILVDDMGYGDPGCFNPDSKVATPSIDSLARDGMRFTDAHAPGPLCHVSRYGLLTGRYPFRAKVGTWGKRAVIERGRTTIASLAKAQGYRTAMVGKWHLGFDEQGYDQPLPGGPVDCGFDTFFGIRASTDIPPYFYIRDDRAVTPPTERIEANRSDGWSPIQGAFWRAGGIAPDLKLDEVLPRFTDEAIDVIKRHQADAKTAEPVEPLLLYLAYPAPHTPWLPSDAFAGKSGAGMYGDFLMMVDAEIGRVLDSLRNASMEKDTLLVFTSDNGPVWYDEDTSKYGHDSSGGLRGMKADAWEAGHRMPFVVRWPERVQAGSTSTQLVCFTDLLATLAEILGVELADGAGPDSFSFLPALTNARPKATALRTRFAMRAGSLMTMRSGNWKLIDGLGSGGFSKPSRVEARPDGPAGQLYDLDEDPGETTNLYAQRPDIVARLTEELARIVEDGKSRTSIASVDTATLHGKLMVGYQGWFNCEGDGSQLGWKHWARQRKNLFAPGNVTVDLWPDVSELDADERYATGFRHADGRVAEVFSSANPKTVARHFSWMRDYGIDGAFLQRFATGLSSPLLLANNNAVLSHVRKAAGSTGRAFAVMYDLSGLGAGQVKRVREDWTDLRTKDALTSDRTYLHHRGKPLVAVWGIGFSDGRAYTLAECLELVRWLKAQGCSVMLGVPSFWRERRRDATADPLLHRILKEADVVSPWSVGRYRTPREAARHADAVWKADLEWCRREGLDFFPVAFPGFSWKNLKGGPLGQIPRLKGEFFWSQATAARRIGCKMLYVAMFDEVDEGTAIFKCTDRPPVGEGVEFLTFEGMPGDHYLRLAGKAARLFSSER